MKRTFVFSAICVLSLSWFAGCSEESKATKTEKVSTPGGSTTVTEETKVKKTGDNPPKAP